MLSLHRHPILHLRAAAAAAGPVSSLVQEDLRSDDLYQLNAEEVAAAVDWSLFSFSFSFSAIHKFNPFNILSANKNSIYIFQINC